MLVRHEPKCKELRQFVSHMSQKQEMFLAMMEWKEILPRDVSGEFRRQIFQEITKLEERPSEGEVELLE